MAKEAEPESYRHSLVPNMSVKEGAVSVQKSKPCNIRVLTGRTGNIVKVGSDRTAIVKDKKYGDITFTEDMLKFSMKEDGMSFGSCFPVGRIVYFDIEVGVRSVKYLSIWVIAGLTFLGLVVVIAALTSLPLYILWNWLMPTLFGLPVITWFQAFGLSCLSGLLFKTTASYKKTETKK